MATTLRRAGRCWSRPVSPASRSPAAAAALASSTLLSALYLVLGGLLVPRLDASAVSAGHMFATVLIAVLVVPLRNRVGIVVGRLLRRDWQTSQALLGDIGAALSRTLSPEGLHAIVV